MKFSDIKNALKHLLKTTRCMHCQNTYEMDEINVIATTRLEGLFELHCNKCQLSGIMTVVVSPAMEIKKGNAQAINNQALNERTHSGISSNDILDVKNFLNSFDGDFKKLFTSEK